MLFGTAASRAPFVRAGFQIKHRISSDLVRIKYLLPAVCAYVVDECRRGEEKRKLELGCRENGGFVQEFLGGVGVGEPRCGSCELCLGVWLQAFGVRSRLGGWLRALVFEGCVRSAGKPCHGKVSS